MNHLTLNFLILLILLIKSAYSDSNQPSNSNTIQNFQNTQDTSRNLETTNQDKDKEEFEFGGIHGTILVICWCFAVDFAVISARYFKSKFYYIEFHALLFWITMIATLIFSFIMIFQSSVRSYLSSDNETYGWHFYGGVALMSLAALEMIGGMICMHEIKGKNPISKQYSKILGGHKIGGYLAIIIGKGTAITGSCLYSTEYAFYLVLYVIIVLIYVFFEIYYCIQNPKWMTRFALCWDWIVFKFFCPTPLTEKHPEYKQILMELKTEQALDIAEKYPNLTFALYRDYLVDLTGIVHSGGTFMNYQVKGREISRFINGSYNLETYGGKSIHQHTQFAVQQIKRHIVGKVDTTAWNIVKNVQQTIVQQEVEWLNSDKMAQFNNDSSVWKLVKRTEILPNIMVIEFSSEKHIVLNYIPGVEWLGRHMAITPANNPYKERLYTTSVFATQNNALVRQQLIELYDKKINNQEIKNYEFNVEQVSPTYPMVIKNYLGKKSLSRYIHTSPETEFLLTGPFGQGMGFNNQSNQTYYFLLGGTTIPLLDLTDVLLKKCIYAVIQAKFGKEEAEKFNPYKQNYDQMFGPNFKVKVLITLKNIDQYLGRDTCAKLLEICKMNSLPIFDMIVRFTNITEEEKATSKYVKNLTLYKNRFTKEFLKENIKADENLGKVFICGPHPFIQDVLAALDFVEKKKLLIL